MMDVQFFSAGLISCERAYMTHRVARSAGLGHQKMVRSGVEPFRIVDVQVCPADVQVWAISHDAAVPQLTPGSRNPRAPQPHQKPWGRVAGTLFHRRPRRNTRSS